MIGLMCGFNLEIIEGYYCVCDRFIFSVRYFELNDY